MKSELKEILHSLLMADPNYSVNAMLDDEAADQVIDLFIASLGEDEHYSQARNKTQRMLEIEESKLRNKFRQKLKEEWGK